jgi:hypothetical protein
MARRTRTISLATVLRQLARVTAKGQLRWREPESTVYKASVSGIDIGIEVALAYDAAGEISIDAQGYRLTVDGLSFWCLWHTPAAGAPGRGEPWPATTLGRRERLTWLITR